MSPAQKSETSWPKPSHLIPYKTPQIVLVPPQVVGPPSWHKVYLHSKGCAPNRSRSFASLSIVRSVNISKMRRHFNLDRCTDPSRARDSRRLRTANLQGSILWELESSYMIFIHHYVCASHVFSFDVPNPTASLPQYVFAMYVPAVQSTHPSSARSLRLPPVSGHPARSRRRSNPAIRRSRSRSPSTRREAPSAGLEVEGGRKTGTVDR